MIIEWTEIMFLQRLKKKKEWKGVLRKGGTYGYFPRIEPMKCVLTSSKKKKSLKIIRTGKYSCFVELQDIKEWCYKNCK